MHSLPFILSCFALLSLRCPLAAQLVAIEGVQSRYPNFSVLDKSKGIFCACDTRSPICTSTETDLLPLGLTPGLLNHMTPIPQEDLERLGRPQATHRTPRLGPWPFSVLTSLRWPTSRRRLTQLWTSCTRTSPKLQNVARGLTLYRTRLVCVLGLPLMDGVLTLTDNLAASAQSFQRGANKVRKQMWCVGEIGRTRHY